jgi:hypothetical protein
MCGGHRLVPAVPSPAPIQAPESQTPARQIGLVLSPNSPASVLALIPGLDPVLADAGYRLVVMTLPGDSTAGRDRVTQLIHDSAGILCCPSIFPAVSVAVANQCPVIALSPWSAKSMVDKISGCPVVGDEEVAELPIVELLRKEPVASPPPVTPVVTPVAAPHPVVAETPIPPPVVVEPEPVIPVVAPVEPVVVVPEVAVGEVVELPVVESLREEPVVEPPTESPLATPSSDPVRISTDSAQPAL